MAQIYPVSKSQNIILTDYNNQLTEEPLSNYLKVNTKETGKNTTGKYNITFKVKDWQSSSEDITVTSGVKKSGSADNIVAASSPGCNINVIYGFKPFEKIDNNSNVEFEITKSDGDTLADYDNANTSVGGVIGTNMGIGFSCEFDSSGNTPIAIAEADAPKLIPIDSQFKISGELYFKTKPNTYYKYNKVKECQLLGNTFNEALGTTVIDNNITVIPVKNKQMFEYTITPKFPVLCWIDNANYDITKGLSTAKLVEQTLTYGENQNKYEFSLGNGVSGKGIFVAFPVEYQDNQGDWHRITKEGTENGTLKSMTNQKESHILNGDRHNFDGNSYWEIVDASVSNGLLKYKVYRRKAGAGGMDSTGGWNSINVTFNIE